MWVQAAKNCLVCVLMHAPMPCQAAHAAAVGHAACSLCPPALGAALQRAPQSPRPCLLQPPARRLTQTQTMQSRRGLVHALGHPSVWLVACSQLSIPIFWLSAWAWGMEPVPAMQHWVVQAQLRAANRLQADTGAGTDSTASPAALYVHAISARI